MSRIVFVYRNGEFVEKGGQLDIREQLARSQFPCPMIITDTQDDIKSMADGKIYSSKSQMRKAYKQAGLIEVGDQASTSSGKHITSNSKKHVIDAYKKVRDGYKPKPLEAYKEI